MAQRLGLAISGVTIKTKSLSIRRQDPDVWCNSVIQTTEAKGTSWMEDAILAPLSATSSVPFATRTARSAILIPRLKGASGSRQSDRSNFDEEWVTVHAELAKEAADVMRREFQRGKRSSPV